MKIAPCSFTDAVKSGVLFIPHFQRDSLKDDPLIQTLPAQTRALLIRFASRTCTGNDGEIKSLWLSDKEPERIVLFGLGSRKKWHLRREALLPRRFVRYALHEHIASYTISFPAALSGTAVETAERFAANSLLANFEYVRYKTPPSKGWPAVTLITIAAPTSQYAPLKEGIRRGIIVGEETNRCRDLANTPGSDMTPKKLAAAAERAGKRTGFRTRSLKVREMEKLGMGGVLGVARGSVETPRFIILEYRKGPKNQAPLVLAGKGVTFDSGGLNVKPHPHMYEMHMDMSGGAAVIFGIAAIARLKLSVNAIGLIPAVENMPSGSSYRPGDLLKSMNGKVIEVLNTDAEGRVILADALTYGLRYKPGLLVDFATLTGAACVALGRHASAVFTQDEPLQEALINIGKASGDYVWPLPMWDEYFSDIKGVFGDVANDAVNGTRYAGATQGAKFLEQFAGNARFAHVDIAPRMTPADGDYLGKGATGVGVRFIAELARQYKALL